MKMNLVNASKTLLVASIGLPMYSLAQKEQSKMNVLMIAVDDLKPTIGAYGDPYAITPNIDRLASEGVLFPNAYCQQAISAASRASIMTGIHPDKTRIWNLVINFRQVNPNVITIPQYFKEAGYTTTATGKIYHVGSSGPDHDGTSWSIPHTLAKAKSYVGEVKRTKKGRGPALLAADVPDSTFHDGQVAQIAIEKLRMLKENGTPFFLGVGFIRPHLPFVSPQKYWDLYDRNQLPIATFQQKAADSPDIAYHNSSELKTYSDIPQFDSYSPNPGELLPIEKQKELIHGYYAAVSYMDAQVGKVLVELDRLGLRENTIVVLWGDHGWHLGDHGLWNKHTNFENATRVPFIISAPNKQKGTKSATLAEFTDLFPTLCELTGLPVPEWMDGLSLVPALESAFTQLRDYALSQYPCPGQIMGYSIRTLRYRYTEWFNNDHKSDRAYDPSCVVAQELYDYETDPLETKNIINNIRYENERKKLETLFRQCMKREYSTFKEYEQRADYQEPIHVNKLFK